MKTYPVVERGSSDAVGFVEGVDRLVAGLVFRYRPGLACIVRVRRWFDHRWLKFSGKGRVLFDPPWRSHVGIALEDFHQEQLTFPPFTPARVASEQHWARQSDGDYVRTTGTFAIHRRAREHSSWNLQRRVADLCDTALFVWFSSTSASDRRGSMLVYIVNDGRTLPWFASMTDDGARWSLGEVKGLGRAEVAELLEHPPGVWCE